jgi:regulator of RNase E activity RraA
MISPLSPETLAALRALDTCSISDAIERTGVRLRNEGFTNSTELCCRFPELAPMVGYAVTLRVRGANPPMQGGRYPEHTQWWESFASLPKPHVLMIEDLDRHPGMAAFIGETHAAIFQAMGCVGIVTNGAVRSLPAIGRRGFQVFSSVVSPSHGYIHVVEAGGPIKVAGLHVSPGDLIHGDCHGLLCIPAQVAPDVPAIAAEIHAQKQRVLDLCDSPDFSREKLRELMAALRS